MGIKIYQGDTPIGDAENYDLYQSQARATFRTNGTLETGGSYRLKFDGGEELQIFITSAPKQGTLDVLAHAAIVEKKEETEETKVAAQEAKKDQAGDS